MGKKPPEFPYEAYRKAVEAEVEGRELAFLGCGEYICGIACEPLTPRKVASLKVGKSPFVVGGQVTGLHIAQFLWIVSKQFSHEPEQRDDFMAQVLELEVEKCRDEIDEYIERAYLDARGGSKSVPLVSMCAWLAHELAGEPYRMNWREVMDTPISVLFQLIKANDISEGRSVANKSHEIRGKWLAEYNQFQRDAKARKEKRRKAQK